MEKVMINILASILLFGATLEYVDSVYNADSTIASNKDSTTFVVYTDSQLGIIEKDTIRTKYHYIINGIDYIEGRQYSYPPYIVKVKK